MPVSEYSAGIKSEEKSLPNISLIQVSKSPFPLVIRTCLPSRINLNETSGCERAILSITPATAFASVTSFLRNFILAGVLQNKSLTIIVVPSGHPASSSRTSSPFSITYLVPIFSSDVFVITSTLATALTLASASPLNPRVKIELRSSTVEILLVAWLTNAFLISSLEIPHPLSVILI